MTVRLLRSHRALALAALLGLFASGCASERAFRQAQEHEQLQHWDLAVLAYEKAVSVDPGNKKYESSLFRARIRAAQVHLGRGRLHRSAGQLDLAKVELEQSVALDPTNDVALQELKRVVEDIEVRRLESEGGSPTEKAKAKARGRRAAPPMLNPASDKPIDVTFPPDTPIKKIYQALCAASGINVIFDPQLKDDKFTLDLRNLSFQKALETTMRQAGHFYKVIDEKTILVAQDTQQNRKEYEDQVVRTFFLSNGDVKDVSQMVRQLLDLRRMGTIAQLNAIVIRDTADKVAVAERLIDVNDKAKAEVVLDVELLQLSSKKLLDLGAALSSYSIAGSLNSGSGTTAPTLPWDELLKLSLSDFNFTVPSIVVNFIKSNTSAEILARPQLRIAEGEKAQLVIGNRVPIPVTTINTQQAIGQIGVVPVTSFQYQDVGIKLDIEARVHHNKEVSLKLTVEVSQPRRRGQLQRPGPADHRDAHHHVEHPAEGRRDELPGGPHRDDGPGLEDGFPVPLGPAPHRPPLRPDQDPEGPQRHLPDAHAAHHPGPADRRGRPDPDLGRDREQRQLLRSEREARVAAGARHPPSTSRWNRPPRARPGRPSPSRPRFPDPLSSRSRGAARTTPSAGRRHPPRHRPPCRTPAATRPGSPRASSSPPGPGRWPSASTSRTRSCAPTRPRSSRSPGRPSSPTPAPSR
jgi:tetratricopeptide (TPR) repeat protein